MKKKIVLAFMLCMLSTAALQSKGVKWQELPGLYGGDIQAITVFSDGILFAATYDEGLFVSHDSAETWTKSDSSLSAEIIFGLSKGKNNVVYAATSNGAFRITNGATHWQALDAADIGAIWINCILETAAMFLRVACAMDFLYPWIAATHGVRLILARSHTRPFALCWLHKAAKLLPALAGGFIFQKTMAIPGNKKIMACG